MSDFQELETMRRQIDQLDVELIRVLGERVEICRKISLFKRDNDIPIMQFSRIEQVKLHCAKLAVANNLEINFVHSLYDILIQETCRIEKNIESVL